MKTVLVTGGAGYIGSHTVRELVKSGYNTIVLDSLENGHRQAIAESIKFYQTDLANKDEVAKVFDENQIDVVIDFAAYLAVGESMAKPEMYLQNNVFNFVNLLDVMADKKCKYIIKSSTAATYGNPTRPEDIPWQESFIDKYQPEKSALLGGVWHTEKMIGEEFFQKFISAYDRQFADRPELKLSDAEITKLKIPMSVYGLTKLLDECLMNKYDEMLGIKSVALRYFNVCGAHPDGDLGDDKPNPTNLMSVAMMQLIGRISELSIFGNDYDTPDGTGVRDYIHPCDLATGHIKAMEYLAENNLSNVFNLGTGQGASVLEVIEACESASDKTVKSIIVPRRSGDPSISIADPGKAKTTLDWQAEFSLIQMAETAWKWHIKHPSGFAE